MRLVCRRRRRGAPLLLRSDGGSSCLTCRQGAVAELASKLGLVNLDLVPDQTKTARITLQRLESPVVCTGGWSAKHPVEDFSQDY